MGQGQYSDMKHGVLFMELLRSHLGSQPCVSGHSQRRSDLRLDSKQTLRPPQKRPENTFTLLLKSVKVSDLEQEKVGDKRESCFGGACLALPLTCKHKVSLHSSCFQVPAALVRPVTWDREESRSWSNEYVQIIFFSANHSQSPQGWRGVPVSTMTALVPVECWESMWVCFGFTQWTWGTRQRCVLLV